MANRPTAPTPTVKPLVVILCLQYKTVFDEYNPDVILALTQKSVVRKAETLSQARRHLNSTVRPHAIIVSDAAVTYPENHELLPRLVEYARAGGTVIYTGIFSSTVLYPDLKAMFKNVWGLPWRVCAHTSSNLAVNPRVKGISTKAIPEKCDVKSTRINNVALEDAVYVTPGEAKKLKKPQEGQSLPDRTYETFAAVAKIGRGRVAYMGHFGPEPVTTNLLLALCFWPGANEPVAPGDGVPEVIRTGIAVAEEGLPPRASTSTGNGTDRTKRNILIISLQKEDHIEDDYAQLYQALRKNATVTEVAQPRAALAALSTAPRPDAVILSDAALASPKQSNLIPALLAYTRSGGTVVLALQFSSHIKTDEIRPFLARWGVPWDSGAYERTTATLNPAGIPASLDRGALLPEVRAKAVHLRDVPRAQAVYVSEAGQREQALESPAALARVGEGYLGYVGGVNAEEGSTRLVLEMCGVEIRAGDLAPRTYSAETTETMVKPPLSAPAPVLRRPRPRDEEVAVRAETRKKVREDKHKRAEMLKDEGNELFGQRKWAEGAEKYRAAALLAGPQPVYVSNLAACLLMMELWEIAESAATRALIHDPNHIEALYRRALARKGLEHYKDAMADLEWLLAIDKMNVPALAEKAAIREAVLARDKNANWFEDRSLRALRDHERAIQVGDDSDSEDFVHPGTGLPCKDYNTSDSGCSKGKRCRAKHAPDLKSVRDELGRNVCVYWLLGHCRFNSKCVYAHDATYLPERGWWNDIARLDRMCAEFDETVEEQPLDLGAGPVSEDILAEAFVPLPWRRDLWAIATYNATYRDGGFGFYEDDENWCEL